MSRKITALRAAADKARSRGDQAEMARLYVELERNDPDEPEWPKRAADAYQRLKQPELEFQALLRAAQSYSQAGFLLKAVAVCKRILRLDPGHTETQMQLAELHSGRRRGLQRVMRRPEHIAAQSPHITAPQGAAARVAARSDLSSPRKEASPEPPASAAGAPGPVRPAAAGHPGGKRHTEAPGRVRDQSTRLMAALRRERMANTAAPRHATTAATVNQPPTAQLAPVEVATQAARVSSIPPRAPLESVHLAAVMPTSRRLTPPDGHAVYEIALDDIEFIEHSPPRKQPALHLGRVDRPTRDAPRIIPEELGERATPDVDVLNQVSETAAPRLEFAAEEAFTPPPVRPAVARAPTPPPAASDLASGAPDIQELELEPAAEEEASVAALQADAAQATEAEDEKHASTPPPPKRLNATLRHVPLFSELDPATLALLIEHVELQEVDAGDVIYSAGDVADRLFVVVRGEVSIVGAPPLQVELGLRRDNDFFGELGVINGSPRPAAAIARAPTELLVIDRQLLSALAAEEPSVLTVLLRFIRERLVHSLILTSPLFANYDASEAQALAARFHFLEVQADAALLSPGQRPDGLYVLLSGSAEVSVRGEVVQDLEAGDIFGEQSLLSSGAPVETVTTSSKCFALRLDVADFREIIMTHPPVLEYLSELADARKSARAGLFSERPPPRGHVDLS